MEAILQGRGLTVGYDRNTVIDGLDVELPRNRFTAIIGPNACGKSTLLKTIARILKPSAGVVTLDGVALAERSTKQVARELDVLPQSPDAPEAIVVRDLVGRGRFPHQRLWRQWSTEDEQASEAAMERAGIAELADREVDTLSGGQRQRVWLAMVLAQGTGVLLLDEPTTFLDIAHQIDVLNLAASLVHDGTVVAVLHDINLACRYADHLICMRDGQVLATGTPSEVVTGELVHQVFDLDAQVIPDPVTGTPLIIPGRPPGRPADG